MVESLILSKLNYGNVLLSDATKFQLQRLQKVQNAAAGFVLKRRANIKDVINLKWLPIVENIDMTIAKAAYNAVNNPNWLSYLRLSRTQPRNRDLRSAEFNENNIDNTSYLKGTFAHEGARCFNDLPTNIKKIESKQSFIMNCRNYYFDKATARILNLY